MVGTPPSWFGRSGASGTACRGPGWSAPAPPPAPPRPASDSPPRQAAAPDAPAPPSPCPSPDPPPALLPGRGGPGVPVGGLPGGQLGQLHHHPPVHHQRRLVMAGRPPPRGPLGAHHLQHVLAVLPDRDLLPRP